MKIFKLHPQNLHYLFLFFFLSVFITGFNCSDTPGTVVPVQTVTTDFPEPGGRAVTIEDYYRNNSIGRPSISPNGRWVSFSYSYPDE